MINQRNISGLLLIVLIAVYKLFADPDMDFWRSYYFTIIDLTLLFSFTLLLKFIRDSISRIIFKIIIGITMLDLLLSFYSFFDMETFNKINRSYEIGGIIIFTVLIFLFYSRYEMDKRKL